jgi:hypothetical protein
MFSNQGICCSQILASTYLIFKKMKWTTRPNKEAFVHQAGGAPYNWYMAYGCAHIKMSWIFLKKMYYMCIMHSYYNMHTRNFAQKYEYVPQAQKEQTDAAWFIACYSAIAGLPNCKFLPGRTRSYFCTPSDHITCC